MLDDGGEDNLRYSVGHREQIGDRNAPIVLNAAYLTRLFWDGRVPAQPDRRITAALIRAL